MMKKNHQSSKIDNSRREFIKRSLLGSGTFFLSSLSPFKIFSENSTLNNLLSSLTEEEALSLSRKAKEFFYRKEYGKASEIYEQLIDVFPTEIKYYHKYGKVLGAQQKLLERAELFRFGMNRNPMNADFMHHLSLNIRRICKGSIPAMDTLENKYGVNELYSYAAELLIDAIEINPSNTNYYLDLKDFQLGEITNSSHVNTLSLPSEINDKINHLCIPYEEKWNILRESKKNEFKESILARAFNTKTPKRNFYNTMENLEWEKNTNKGKIRTLYPVFLKSIDKESYNKRNAEIYATRILDTDVTQTHVVGKMRKLYRQKKDYQGLLEFNQYLYQINPTINNALSLTVTMIKYPSNADKEREVIKILNTIKHVDSLPTIYASMYYYSLANYHFTYNYSNEIGGGDGRKALLKGLEQFDGLGGCSYSLMELYALSYAKSHKEHGVNILQSLITHEPLTTHHDDPINEYITKYQAYRKENLPSKEEINKISVAINKCRNEV